MSGCIDCFMHSEEINRTERSGCNFSVSFYYEKRQTKNTLICIKENLIGNKNELNGVCGRLKVFLLNSKRFFFFVFLYMNI